MGVTNLTKIDLKIFLLVPAAVAIAFGFYLKVLLWSMIAVSLLLTVYIFYTLFRYAKNTKN